MKVNVKRIVICTLVLAFASANAFAMQRSGSRVETTSVAAILENLDSIQAALDGNDPRLAGLTAAERGELATHQARVRKLLAGRQTVEEVPNRDRMTAFNSLETIHGLVTGKKEERVVCRRDHVVGSNRPQTNCMTARERQEAREAAAQAMAVRGVMLRHDGI